jgi:hypothetical protein
MNPVNGDAFLDTCTLAVGTAREYLNLMPSRGKHSRNMKSICSDTAYGGVRREFVTNQSNSQSDSRHKGQYCMLRKVRRLNTHGRGSESGMTEN